jgi:translation initiation factor IF-3
MPVKNENLDLVNENIKSAQLLVIDENGEQLGVLSKEDALEKAYDRDLDLVVVAAKANPPVAKILDYSKYKYEQQKRQKENKKNQKIVQVKEIRLSPTIDTHDFDTRVKQAVKFLAKGDKVKVSLRMPGRMITHANEIKKVMVSFYEALESCAKLDQDIKMDGKLLLMTLAPKKE